MLAHGKPQPLDVNEPLQLAEAINEMKLQYVVVTSVDRDDLKEWRCITLLKHVSKHIRQHNPATKIEIFIRIFVDVWRLALQEFTHVEPDVFNHNLETVPRLYKQARPGADYHWSLTLLREFKAMHPDIPTKSGIMLGLGETKEEVIAVMQELREP